MAAIDNIRRALREHDYMRCANIPFAGAVHDFSKPLRKRFDEREYAGPYHMSPAKPGGGRGFYSASMGLACGSGFFSLRLEYAYDYLSGSRLKYISGYHCDHDGEGDTLTPIIARLPHGRGFLAGWTMGRGMLGAVDLDIYDTPEEAARAAHDVAERDAERNREEQEREQGAC